MTDVKRNYSEVGTPSDTHSDKKVHTKPGRKPIETEPKSKRTAQNRAAQRAYRERKERKMKDLEDMVKSLEDENIKAATEKDFLKAQVAMLKSELARYRGHSDFSDLQLPSKVGHLSNPQTGGYVPSFDSKTSKSSISESSDSNNSPSVDRFFANFPWSKDKLSSLQDSKSNNNNFQLPDLVSGSSSSTSPLNDNILVSPDSSNTTDSVSNPNTVNSHQFDNLDFPTKFEEQVDPFCAKLNEACGTKQYPIPKYKRSESKIDINSPFSVLVPPSDEKSIDYLNDPFFSGDASNFNFSLSSSNNDPLSFLNDSNFDVSLAFADNFNPNNSDKKDFDPISVLTTEESVYDPLKDSVNVNFNFNEFVKSSLPSESSKLSPDSSKNSKAEIYSSRSKNDVKDYNNDDNEVVPAPEQTIRCSEIWDRITAHPKYTEIDIDSLCTELKNKAKCSEKGVVINSADVNQLLEQSAVLKR